MSDLSNTTMKTPSPGNQCLEIVERKEPGHPATVCDTRAEALSQTLWQLRLAEGTSLAIVRMPIKEIFHTRLSQIKSLRQELMDGTIKVY